MPLGTGVGLGPGVSVRWGPIPQKGHSPQFSAHVYCCQTAVSVCIRIPLGTEVGLSLGDIVLDWDPASPPRKGNSRHQFSANVCCGQTAGLIKMPLGTEVNIGPGDVVLDGIAAPTKRGTAPSFRSMSIVAKRLNGSRCHLVRK